MHFNDVQPILLRYYTDITISVVLYRYYNITLEWLWNGVIKRRLMVKEDLLSMKLGAIDFGLFDATQLLGGW